MNAERPMQKYLERAEARQQVHVRELQDPASGSETQAEIPCLMLDLVMADGSRYGLPYSSLAAVTLSDGGTLTLEFPGHTVSITGRGLLPLYRHLLSHFACEIAMSISGMDEQRDACWIKTITVTAKQHAEP